MVNRLNWTWNFVIILLKFRRFLHTYVFQFATVLSLYAIISFNWNIAQSDRLFVLRSKNEAGQVQMCDIVWVCMFVWTYVWEGREHKLAVFSAETRFGKVPHTPWYSYDFQDLWQCCLLMFLCNTFSHSPLFVPHSLEERKWGVK